jgi:DNA-binding response OmpR family regulator
VPPGNPWWRNGGLTAGRSGAGKHVLIVEDSEIVTDALRVLFEESGYQVSLAHTLAEARTVVSRAQVDVAIVDLRLPDGDGVALAQEWRTSGPPAVALTGDAGPETRDRAIAAGFQDSFVNPVPIAELLLRVAELTAE